MPAFMPSMRSTWSHFQPTARLFGRAFEGWTDDGAPSMGAALAFYTLVSLAPVMVIVIAVVGFAIGHEAAEELLLRQLSGLLGETGAQGVKSVLDATAPQRGGWIATATSVAIMVAGATTVFAELRLDLDRIWKQRAPRSTSFWRLLRSRVLSFGMVVAIGFLLLVSLVVSAALSFVTGLFGATELLLRFGEFATSMLVTTGLFALTYKVLPTARIPWRDVWPGAVVTAFLFWIGKYLIGLYLGRSALASSYGAAGTLVVAIMWVYYSAQVFFYGAEFTREYSLSHGSGRSMPTAANSDFVADAAPPRPLLVVARGDPVAGGPGPP